MSGGRYPAYVGTGVDVLPEVPAHWALRQLGRVGQLLKGRGGSKDDIAEQGVPCIRYGDLYTTHDFVIRESRTFIAPADAVRYTPLRQGDVLFAASGETFEDIGKSAANLIDGEAYCGGDVVILRTSGGFAPAFLGYATDSVASRQQKASMGRGTTVKHIYPDELRKLWIPVPPLVEQERIVEFLDSQLAHVEDLIAEQQRLIELLAEKRQAVISHAVTKGLNPDAPMKPSGVEWLGAVPAHWRVGRVKSAITFITSGPRGWSERVGDSGSLFIQSGDVNDSLEIEFGTASRVTVENDAEATRTRLREGDVVVCITGAKTGNIGLCSALPEAAFVNQHLALIRPQPQIRPAFLAASLKSLVGRTHFQVSQYGLKQGLSLQDVKDAPLLIPSLSEQDEIVRHIDSERARSAALLAAAERAIELLHERRSALISAAVTGQIDVRGHVAVEVA